MKVYLASWFASKDDMSVRAEQLRASGIEVTSRWLQETVKPTTQIKDVADNYLRETAQIDIEDILAADTVVLNVPSAEDLKREDMPISSWARGGRHFEAGFQYATMYFFHSMPAYVRTLGSRRLILVGHKENVFHYLDGVLGNGFPTIETFSTWEEARTYLLELSKPVRIMHY